MTVGIADSGEESSQTLRQISKVLWRKALPITGSVLLITSGKFVRQKLLSGLSQADFAGADLASGVQNFLFSPITSLIKQNAIFAAELMGEMKKNTSTDETQISERYAQLGKVLRQAWILSIASGCLVSILVPLTKPLFLAAGIQRDVVDSTEAYLLPVMLSIPARIAILANQRFIVAVNQEKWLIPFTIFAVAQSIVFDWVFLSFFKDIRGAAWSTVTQAYLNLALNILLLSCHSSFKKYNIFSLTDIKDTTYIKKTLAQGWPLSFRDMALAGRVLMFRIVMSSAFGKFALVADQVGKFFYTSIEEAFALALNEAGNRLTAQQLGAAKKEKSAISFSSVARFGNSSAVFALSSYTVLAATATLLYKPLSNIFLGNNEIEEHQSLLETVFLAMSIEYFCNVGRRSFASNLSACEDTFLASFISVATTFIITIPTAMLAIYVFDAGQSSIYLSIALGFSVDAVILFNKWRSTTTKMQEDLDYDPQSITSNAYAKQQLLKMLASCSRLCPSIFARGQGLTGVNSDTESSTPMLPTGLSRDNSAKYS